MKSDNAAKMSPQKKSLLLDAIPSDQRIIERYILADRVSSEQTAHGLPHALNVRDIVTTLIGYVLEEYPGRLTEDEVIAAKIAGLLHDNGRAEEIARHGVLGARWANQFLRSFTLPGDTETLPAADIKRIVKAVACHSFKEFMKARPDDVLDVLYIGDKCAGDETRVREDRAAYLAQLTSYSRRIAGVWFRLTWLSDRQREGGEHDRVNFAIKESKLEKDGRQLVLNMRIDERVCSPSLIWSVRWNRSAYKGCWLAAKRLGFEFTLQINGVRYHSQGEEADWRAR